MEEKTQLDGVFKLLNSPQSHHLLTAEEQVIISQKELIYMTEGIEALSLQDAYELKSLFEKVVDENNYPKL